MNTKRHAAGRELADAQRRVLLREPTGHYDGYVAQITQKIPGQLDGSTTTNGERRS